MPWRLTLIGLLLTAPAYAQTPEEADWTADEAVLTEQRLPSKGPELLSIFRARTPTLEIAQQFKNHVARLQSASFAERAKATAGLTKMGPVVRPLLENLLQEIKTDAETMGRLRLVLEQFPADKDYLALIAAARLLQRDKPAGSVPVLLDFAAYATDEQVRQEVQRALNGAAAHETKQASLLVAALKDAQGPKRAAAAEALARLGNKEAIEPLLRDPHPLVRYQLGLALVESRDKAGVPFLIQTLTDASSERAERALDLLYRLAGDSAPTEAYQGKQKAEAFRAVWQKWYDAHHAGLDIAQTLSKSAHASTVIISAAVGVNARHSVFELAPDHRSIRWQFDGPRNPMDLQILGSNRLLIAEYLDRRVTERDFKGNILWQVPAVLPIACQRLPNGQTFIATRQNLAIVDREGKEAFTWRPPSPTITTATRLRNGQMVVVLSGGRCLMLDAKGVELKTVQLGQIYALGGNIEILSNGRILTPLTNANCIVEYDWDGNKVWQATVSRPNSVTRLPNGHTLVTCNFDARVVEIDKTGQEVWSFRTEGRPYRARPR